METYTIYCHTFPNGKMYFGQTCKKTDLRWRSNGKGYKNQSYVWNAIQKYGWNNIEHRIISTGLSKEEADFQEMFYITSYRTNEHDFGYNLTTGGETGREINDEYRARLRDSHKGKHSSPQSEFKKGSEPWNKGKSSVYSDETKERMRLAKLGKHFEKLKWTNEKGEIFYMAERYVKRSHPDWRLIE